MGPTKGSRAAKSAAAAAQSLPTKTFIIDNGAYTMKAGYAPSNVEDSPSDPLAPCLMIPNALVKTRDKRVYTGPQLNTHVTDWNEAAFRRPVEKGYIVNWEAQREIWDHSFFDEKIPRRPEVRCTDPGDTTLILTEAPNAMAALQKNADEMVMEEWGFGGYLRCIGPTLNAWNDVHSLFGDPVVQNANSHPSPVECLLVIDSGYSHTTITPVYRGRPLHRAIRRLEIGGKFLTNYLKELITIRQYEVLDETYVINEVKEAVCYVSHDFAGDIEKTKRGNKKGAADGVVDGIVVDYVLPDPNIGKKGFMRPHDPLLAAKKRKELLSGPRPSATEDLLVLGNERFVVPELLFHPDDIGMKQPGIPEIVMQSLSTLPTALHPAFLANVFVVGGNALIPGMVERLESDLRQLASAECIVRVRKPVDPLRSAWRGATQLASNRDVLKEVAITRQQYQEYGSGWTGRKFSGAA
ncbi:Actin- protein 6 [Coccidioides posadasii str. Silveira]|uniref:Actin-like protein ARP6 n=3 Tax=Coccidioides posadasii TaxID=199306 RepID=E9D6X7_COCPS|nr:Actin family protein [Coccidioides posadasii C735 delta SOWgp]EER28360.1 Actin family protein [Coccidioides posadasii C735 delta SOWgp]EFW17999.1 actin [Coccidioides posadasii str. Silveira]KMM68685.1 actin-71 [Coccidioides posadasii RMSCC 3488]QVM10031.1 Actin- protein 6 [Coccidioides posadasii str. Silveira]|eukprot:XP_003070505.1 Actin family protein [Coccidioides posadasii C735 delta SOWgp]